MELWVTFLDWESTDMLLTILSNETSDDFREHPGLLRELLFSFFIGGGDSQDEEEFSVNILGTCWGGSFIFWLISASSAVELFPLELSDPILDRIEDNRPPECCKFVGVDGAVIVLSVSVSAEELAVIGWFGTLRN